MVILMDFDAAHQSGWKTAHIIFGSILLLGLLLHFSWPLSVQPFTQGISLHFIGMPLLLLGTVIIMLSKREMEAYNQPSEPKAATSRIIQTGMFKYSRNPLYLGLFIAFCGLAVATDKLWWLILTPLLLALTHYLLIAPEEKYLERKFGDEYLNYRKKVRRWI